MIYFLRNADRTAIKIGTTIRLSARLKTLAAEHGELEVLAVIDGGRDQEKGLHRRFADLRTVGEWFEPGDDLLGFIVSEGKPWDGLDDTDSEATSQARIELPVEEFDRVRAAARSLGLSVSGFIRMSVLEKTRRIEEGRD